MDFGQRESMPMAEETTVQFLHRRKRELAAQISALRGQLAPKEAELQQIEQMLASINPPVSPLGLLSPLGITAPLASLPQLNSNEVLNESDAAALIDAVREVTSAHNEKMFGLAQLGAELEAEQKSKYLSMTIKELVIQALIDHFPRGGTLSEIREFIREGYGREIEAASMRPQVHRLKADGILGQAPATDTWNFRDGKRSIYAMYDHPTSRKAMKELQDDANATAEELRMKERQPDRGGRAAVMKPHQDDFLG
jgi:hypothetical protein